MIINFGNSWFFYSTNTSLFLYFNLEIGQSMLSFIFFLVLLKLTPLVALQTFIWLWKSISLTEFPCNL